MPPSPCPECKSLDVEWVGEGQRAWCWSCNTVYETVDLEIPTPYKDGD